MQWGSDWFQEMRDQHLSQLVTYERPGKFILVDINATVSRAQHAVDAGNGVSIAYEDWAFIIKRAQLSFDGLPVLPQVGDKIAYEIGGKVYHYDVSNSSGGPPWRDHDRFKDSIEVYADHYEVS